MTALLSDLDRALAERALTGAPGGTASRRIAAGDGWRVGDVVCTAGPDDRPFEERHDWVGIAVVAAGSFHYRSSAGRELLTPGSLLLGNAGQCFECGHEHGRGDRCIAFQLSPELFERLAADVGVASSDRRFRAPRLPPLRSLAPAIARACAGVGDVDAIAWEELVIELAARAVELAAGLPHGGTPPPPGADGRAARAVRRIERDPAADHTLSELALAAGLSPFHFLRCFERVTGVTPHQFVLRTRLRTAALALARGARSVLEVAFDAGFGDLSNFNRSFRAELGATPSRFRESFAGRWPNGT